MSDLVDALFAALMPRIEAEFALAHGRLPGGTFAVLALGKYGGRELTAGSDLDLVLIYDAPADAREPIPPEALAWMSAHGIEVAA